MQRDKECLIVAVPVLEANFADKTRELTQY